jgi:hypothetical protein
MSLFPGRGRTLRAPSGAARDRRPGQQRLKAASVLLIGAGGLGAPAALYLAAAGVGRIGHRRIRTPSPCRTCSGRCSTPPATWGPGQNRGGTPPVSSALNPEVTIETHRATPLTADNAAGADQPATTWCSTAPTTSPPASPSPTLVWRPARTLVSGAIARWTGQIGVYPGRPCYRCLVPGIPPDADTCATVGVVGALGGVIGSMMALEAVKLITGAGEPLSRPAADLRRPGGRDPHGADRSGPGLPGLRRRLTKSPRAGVNRAAGQSRAGLGDGDTS